jgi:hypothetical protein
MDEQKGRPMYRLVINSMLNARDDTAEFARWGGA